MAKKFKKTELLQKLEASLAGELFENCGKYLSLLREEPKGTKLPEEKVPAVLSSRDRDALGIFLREASEGEMVEMLKGLLSEVRLCAAGVYDEKVPKGQAQQNMRSAAAERMEEIAEGLPREKRCKVMEAAEKLRARFLPSADMEAEKRCYLALSAALDNFVISERRTETKEIMRAVERWTSPERR